MINALRDDLPRQPLYGLIAALLLALLPHLSELAPWHAALIILPLLWRVILAWRGKALPPRWIRLLLIAALVGVVLLQFRTIIGREGGVALLASLLAVKTLETRQRRDARVLSLLAWFTTGAAFLVSQSFWVLAYALVCSTAIMAQLRSWQRLDGKLDVYEYKRAGWMLLEALPVMLLLFVLFPRLSGPLWAMPDDKPGASTGLSDEMAPGSFNNLALDDSVAFRVDFEGKTPPQSALYWRGPVFERFDGRTWQALTGYRPATPSYQALGSTVRYTMTLEPHNRPWLLALDLPMPGTQPPGTRLTSRLQLVSDQIVAARKRIQLQSTLAWQMQTDDVDVSHDLLLPDQGNPRAHALAATWRNLAPAARVQAALNYLRSNGYTYTLDAPLLPGTNTIDDLLFKTREGFCEHYASAFTFLMRAAGVPARVIVGYQGGQTNGDYFIVRQTDAHAWSEVWLAGRGWQRVDPTAVVAPGRVTQGMVQSISGAEKLPFMLRNNIAWLAKARLHWDAVVYGWNRWIIGYDAQRQLQLFGNLGIDDFTSPRLLAWLSGCALSLLLAYALLHRWQSRRTEPDAAQRAWRQFLQRLVRHGLVPALGEGPQHFARRVASALPAHANEINAICAAYLSSRYHNQTAQLALLVQQVRAFRP